MTHKTQTLLALTCALGTAGGCSSAMAGGFELTAQSIASQGTGHAGRSSNVQDATIVFGNPAGMAFLDRAQLSTGLTGVQAGTDIRRPSSDFSTDAEASLALLPFLSVAMGPGSLGPVAGHTDGDMVPASLIPYAFYAHPVSDRLSLGVGVYAPFGAKTDYEDDFQGRYHGTLTELTVVTAQPTLSYRLTDDLSIGAGVTYNRAEGELAAKVPDVEEAASGTPPSPETDEEVGVAGDDDAWGYHLGLMYRPSEATSMGLTYRSAVDFTLEGEIETTGFVQDRLPNQPGSLDLTTPESVSLSLTHRVSEPLTLMAGAAWTRWSRFEEIAIDGETSGDRVIVEPQAYSNAWVYSVGAEYRVNPRLALRTGFALDDTPTNDRTRSVRVPSDDRRLFSLGLGWTPWPELTVDLAYTYIREEPTWVDQARAYSGSSRVAGLVDIDADASTYFGAGYETEAHALGAALTYRF
ncbi:OmpP1/FadL family transporter [Halomonas beimenensis]|uniref:Long-chain fatty acid transport protein n=1 Tax=Halomonas beimenensis TaxID=475662 RepID=A0A291PBM6_9GAMM|nr:TonB-dependent receptor [Halomonas beimenensis]ATJ84249.1 long-chain fatty acid transport protein [Halomonas beimenensis]